MADEIPPWKSVQKLDMVKVSISPNCSMLTAVLTILLYAIYRQFTATKPSFLNGRAWV